MNKPWHHIIQFACIMVILAAIALQGFTHQVKMKPLEGVVANEEETPLSFKSFLDGSYQDYLTEHAKRNTGFREFFIRNYNQVRYSCFDIVTNINVIEGKEDDLFTQMYLDDITGKRIEDYFGSIDDAKAVARENVGTTLRLMDTLKQHGTDFLFVFAPSKAAVYPEHVPEPYCNQLSDFSLIDYYIELFEENGIPYIDFHNYFKQIKGSFPYPLYSKYGTHWSYATIPMVSDSILDAMEIFFGKNLPSIEVTDMNLTTDYSGQDRELEGQFNLLFPLSKPAIPNPEFVLTDTVGKDKPNLVAIADSYFVAFEKCCFLDAFNSWNYLKYNDYIISSNPEYNWKRIGTLPEAYKLIEDADIVMAVFTAPMLYTYMFDFPEMVFNLFATGQPTDEDKIEMMMQTIRNNPEWYDAVIEQAQQLGITTEEYLRQHAIYVIESKKHQETKSNP